MDTIRLIWHWKERKRFIGAGFEIRNVSTWEIEYREEDRVLKVGTGIGRGSRKWYDTWTTIELPGNLHWEPPHEDERITLQKKEEIELRIAEYFDKWRIPYKVIQ